MSLKAIAVRMMAVLMFSPTVGLSTARAQQNPQRLLQLEVADSIGLPLPDAKLELFAVLQGGIFWEWVAIDPAYLPEGTDLIRVSMAGYTPVVLSVPLQAGSHVALRVRLDPAHDSTTRWQAPEAAEIRAKGFAIQGRMNTDVIGIRRVLDRADIERAGVTGLAALLGRAHNTDLKILPASGASFRPYSSPGRSPSGRRISSAQCSLPVMLNGDRRRILPFEAADQQVPLDEIEAIEIFPRGAPPAPYAVPGPGWCGGLLVVWARGV